jgi:thioredoxin 1
VRLINTIVGVVTLATLMMAMLAPVEPPDDFWFQSVVVEEPRPVVVKFGAEWCGPCVHMEQVLDELASSVSGQVKIVRVDIDEMPQLASHYSVSTIPRIFLFQDGRVVSSHGGFQDAKSMKSWLDRKL